jgi:hypothetical protein
MPDPTAKRSHKSPTALLTGMTKPKPTASDVAHIKPLPTISEIMAASSRSSSIGLQSTADVQRKLAPLCVVVGAKGRYLGVTALAIPRHLRADQINALAVAIGKPAPLEDDSIFELNPTQTDLTRIHERLLLQGWTH